MGAVVVDELAFLVGDVGTRLSPDFSASFSTRPVFWQFNRIHGGYSSLLMPDAEAFPWYRKM